jgi:hypothetical protein
MVAWHEVRGTDPIGICPVGYGMSSVSRCCIGRRIRKCIDRKQLNGLVVKAAHHTRRGGDGSLCGEFLFSLYLLPSPANRSGGTASRPLSALTGHLRLHGWQNLPTGFRRGCGSQN